jgi:predicted nucleic acid-binding protein
MILVDTSIWIEFFKTNEPVFSEMKNLIESGKIITHSLIFAELFQGCKNKTEADLIFNYWENLHDNESSLGIIEAGIFAYEKKLISKGVGLIDAVIICEAKRRNAEVWSLDKKMLSLLNRSAYYNF